MKTKDREKNIQKYKEEELQLNVKENNKVVKINKKKVTNIILFILFNIIFPYVIYLISNITNSAFLNIKMFKITDIWYFISFIYEFIIVYGVYFLFKAIFKKSLTSNICLSIVLNLISIISFYKVSIVQKPFLPEDLFLIGNTLEIIGYGNLKLEGIVVLQIILSVIILGLQFVITKYTQYEKTPKIVTRIIMGIISVILLLFAILYKWDSLPALSSHDLDPRYDYILYGATVDFFKNIPNLIYKPELEIYTEEAVKAVQEEVENSEYKVEGDNPNIIVIMAESFSDITKLEQIKLDNDPIANYRSLSETYANGNIVTSIYGGETSMSEFEFLTASSTRFLNGEKYPYIQMVKSDEESIVKALKQQGYYTTAIHPNYGGFYNRKSAYQRLGFDKTIFLEDMENVEQYYNEKVSDMDTIDEIINQYENSSSDKKFIFAVTIESHTPYESEKYNQKEINLVEHNLSDEQVSEVETYVQGIHNLDKALKYLTDYFSKKEEDVMIVLYGDHLPPLNYLYDNEYGETIQKYQTPYLIWTNYDKEIEDEENISIAGLAMKIMENANIELPWYYRYISNFYKEYPVCTNRFLIDKDGNSVDYTNNLIDNYNIIQYYLLYK